MFVPNNSYKPIINTPASSTPKTGRHDIAEILLKVALNTKNQNQIKSFNVCYRNLFHLEYSFFQLILT